jgi:hypothetical protein
MVLISTLLGLTLPILAGFCGVAQSNSSYSHSSQGFGRKQLEVRDVYFAHVLNRAPDQEGLNYWQTEFAREGDTLSHRARILNNFAISIENVYNVAPLIADGILYQE